MTLSEIANIAEALAVIVAVIFGISQFQSIRVQRRRDATYALMNSLMTKDMLRAISVLDTLPSGLGKAAIEQQTEEDYWNIQLLLGTWESLGILVSHGDLSLDLVDDFYSGPIIQSWTKLSRLVEDVRSQTDRSTRWEYFQWLSERMIARESRSTPIPVYAQHRETKL